MTIFLWCDEGEGFGNTGIVSAAEQNFRFMLSI
jgi:hypothetical protein